MFWLATIFFLEFSPYIDIYDKSVTLRQEKFKLEKFTLTLMSLESNSSNLNNAFQYIPILLIANNNTHISPKGPRSFFYYASKKSWIRPQIQMVNSCISI